MTNSKKSLSNNHNALKSSLLSPAALTGLCSIIMAAIMAIIYLSAAIIPLVLFIVISFIAPFFPRRGFFLPVISRGYTGKKMVAITFDDGPDPATTIPLLRLLAKYHIKATFFVIGEKAIKYSQIIREIIKRGHDIGNHSYHHDPLLMLRSSKKLREEIEAAQTVLKKLSIIPYAFRPPAGITNPKLGRILSHLEMYCVTFSCRGFDGGNRDIKGLARKILKKVKPDDIIVLHDVKPGKGKSVDQWLEQIDLILSGLEQKNIQIVSLAELVGRPVMKFEHGDTVK